MLEYGTTVETVVFTVHQNEHAGIVIHLHGMQEKPPVALCRSALPPNAPFVRQIPASSTNPAEIRALFWLSVLIATLQNGCKRQRAPLIGTPRPSLTPARIVLMRSQKMLAKAREQYDLVLSTKFGTKLY